MTENNDIQPAQATRPNGAGDLWGTVDFPLKRHVSPHGQVTAVSMMKDEGAYVIEWVAHHLAVGFSDLVVYTNDCSDGTDDMLIRLEELGLCHHRRNVIPEGIRPQPSALNYAQDEPVVQQSDWVMVFDADEFLSIRYGDGTLDSLLAATKAQGANGIVVTWRIFGSGGVVDWSRAPVTEQYLWAAPQEWNKGWGVKTLFTFSADKWKLGIHRPKMKTKWHETDFPDQVKWLNGSGREMEDYFKFRGWRSITRTVGYDWVQLNHYAVKSVDSYAIRKMRGNVNNKADKYNSDYWSLQDRNEVRDDTMLRYTDQRNQIIAQLLQDPVLHRLHHAAIDRAEARLAELRQTEAYHQLVADLARASAVPITQIVAKPPQARDKEKIAALMSEVEKRRGAKAKSERQALPKEPVEAVPMGSYQSGDINLSQDIAAEVYPNHSMKLPLDARIFTDAARALIQSGKFERGLARRMPQVLAEQAKVLEIGSAVGFLAGHCANIRPDLRFYLHEENPSLRQMMGVVSALSHRAFNDRFVVVDQSFGDDPAAAILAMIADVQPDALLLADPLLGPETLQLLFSARPAPSPAQIFLYGRLLEQHHAALPEIEALLASLGYVADFGFDANIARGFRLQRASDQDDNT
ncbi:glycosyltransferase family 2 protein [Cypionkella sinensis]|uniref:Glycosyltransferase family 2 protein n=1 Tax=Cypionkella sinensis TaxID=1756043 RepID=A0ABV7J4U3_9RHOB